MERASKAVLAKYIKHRIHIRMNYKDKTYIAHVRRDVTIKFPSEGAGHASLQKQIYYSPSAAVKAIVKHGVNGWATWCYERTRGDWKPIDLLRRIR